MTTDLTAKVQEVEAYAGRELPYLHHLAGHNPDGFEKYRQFMPLAAHISAADLNHLTIARLAAMQHEDCGTCLQINVDLAVKAGADHGVIQAVLDQNPADLKDDLQRRVYHYAISVCENRHDVSERLADLTDEIGPAAVSDLALAIAATRLFPILKRGLGFAISCSRVRINVPAVSAS